MTKPPRLAPRMGRFAASPTVAAAARAMAAQAAGRPVISLTTGEPDFDTPPHIQEAAIAAMRAGETRYTAVDGTPALKAAVRAKFERENGLDYASEEVIVSTGAKQVIFNAVLATIGEGDEVVIPQPAWVSYGDIVKLAGGVPVPVVAGPETGFKPTAAAIAEAITPATRMVMLNSPCNPSGAVLSAGELQAIADVIAPHPDILVICDDIYEHLVYEGAFATIAAAAPGLKDRVLTVNGVSKAYAMTGWRIGFGGGPAWWIAAMKRLQSQSTTSACSVSQAAAVAALEGGLATVEVQRRAFHMRRDRLVARLSKVPGLTAHRPEGAFYLFIGVEGWLPALGNEAAVVDALLDQAEVAVVGGAGFGLSPYIRLSFAASDADLDEAAARIERFAAGLNL